MKRLSFIAFSILFSVSLFTQERISREDVEWLDIWIPNTLKDDKPRIILIGNSITRSYYREVESQLKDIAYVAQFTTSKSIGDPALLDEISLVLKNTPFDVIHFNNGLHGWGYTEEEYRSNFPSFLEIIRSSTPEAKLIWASSTPTHSDESRPEFPEMDRIKTRNAIALECIKGKEILFNDLFTLGDQHPEYYEGGDGIHLNSTGIKAFGTHVANFIREMLVTN